MKKILGTSGTQSMRWLSLQPSDPGYYIEDCRILRLYVVDLLQKLALSQNRKIVSECMVVGQWHYRKLQRFPPKIKSWSFSHIKIMFYKIFGEKLTRIFILKKQFCDDSLLPGSFLFHLESGQIARPFRVCCTAAALVHYVSFQRNTVQWQFHHDPFNFYFSWILDVHKYRILRTFSNLIVLQKWFESFFCYKARERFWNI